MRHNQDIIAPKDTYIWEVRRFLVILFICFYSLHLSIGQGSQDVPDTKPHPEKIDSITTLVQGYYNRCYTHYRLEQHDSVIKIANQGISLAKSNGLRFLEAQLLETKALSLEFLDIDQSIEVYLQAIGAYVKAGQAKWIDEVKFEGVGNAHTILIRMYARKGDMTQAMYHYDLIEEIVQDHQYYTRKAMYESMAFAQAFAGDFEEAIRYFKLSISLSRLAATSSKEVVRGLEENHALIALYYQEIDNRDSSLYYIDLARDIAADSIQSRIRGRAMVSRITGELFLSNGDIDSAFHFLSKAYSQYAEIGDIAELSRTAAPLSQCFTQKGELNNALELSEKAVDWAEQSGDLISLQSNLKSRYAALAKSGLLKEAIEINTRLEDVSNIVSSRQNKMLTEAFAKRYEANEKQNKIDLQSERINRQRTLLYAGGIITLLLLALSFMAYSVASHRKKANKLLVTQRDQLAQLDIVKSNFFANVSHELKTPLTLILAPLSNVLEKSSNKHLNKDLKRAHRNGEKLLGLVNELLDLSKLESGRLEVKNTAVNLFYLTQRIINSFGSIIEVRKIKIELDYHLDKETIVLIDSEKFEKIATNLISNAIKFSNSNAHIFINIHVSNKGRMLLSVRDEGHGISMADQQKIFKRYYQSNEGSSVQGGTGIGLAIVSELVELMGGSVDIESFIGKGSTFTIELPYKLANSKNEAIIPIREASNSSQHNVRYSPTAIFESKPKLLIIEDDIEMNQFLFDTLSVQYQCSSSYNGAEGLERIGSSDFDCVTCDVMMPEMDGFEFIKRLRERELYNRTPVMMLTARTLEEDLLKGFSLGVDDYVVKPFSTNEVVARVNALIINKQARDQWRIEEGGSEEKIESFEMLQLKSAEDFILNNLKDPSIKVKDLADHMNYSVRQVTRITKKLCGLSPSNFIKEIRLQKAHFLIERRQFSTIAEVRYEVGFQNSSYFSKAFLERFGVRPGEL